MVLDSYGTLVDDQLDRIGRSSGNGRGRGAGGMLLVSSNSLSILEALLVMGI